MSKSPGAVNDRYVMANENANAYDTFYKQALIEIIYLAVSKNTTTNMGRAPDIPARIW